MTLGDLKSRVWLLMGGNEVTHPNITDDVLRVWANMAIREMVEESGCLQARYERQLTAGTQEYEFPDAVESIYWVAYDEERIRHTSKWDLMNLDDSWDTRQGRPRRYYLDGLNRSIGLWPTPSTSTVMDGSDISALGLEYHANVFPADVTQTDDEPSLPVWAHPGVLFFMLWKAYSMVGPQRDSKRAQFFARRYREVKGRLVFRSHDRTPAKRLTMLDRVGHSEPWLAVPQYPELIDGPED